ncbi:AAA family ATPase [Thiobaca trueperi]|uniref:RecA-family ATPase n=1 Tax=Thiobaca trueperi TaxID=127458 RepID=A0A4R3MXI6_9GAMM|nr:AAA family ATPase [Thiobaca trueperi]TCT20276.1 RecA-family ATPase [Thiobaca trueperi]
MTDSPQGSGALVAPHPSTPAVNPRLLLTVEIPQTMREAPRWLVWRLEPNPDPTKKPRKIPYYCDGSRRQGVLDTQADWDRLCTFEQMLEALDTGRFTGAGFALGPDGTGNHWQGIDLDQLDQRSELVAVGEALPGYIETSPSGTGLHAIGYGLPFKSLGSNQSGIEAYAAGRYFTVTGDAVRGDIEDVSAFVVETLAPLHSPGRDTTRQTAHPVPGESFHAKMNSKALQTLSAWVPALLPKARPYHDGFRVSSADLGRNLEEDLSILPAGIKDFGEEVGRTPIDLVLDWGPAKDATEAALWLCAQIGINPATLGWKTRQAAQPRENARPEPPPQGDGSPAAASDPAPRANGGRSQPSIDPGAVTVVTASSIKPEPIDWMWEGWIARGKVEVLAGAPGTGKTTLAMALAATLTIGGRWPDGTHAEPGHVLIWSGEDDPRDTLVPRLLAAGANLDRVHIVTGFIQGGQKRSFDPSKDALVLADHIAEMDPLPALLIVDPIVSAVAGDSNKAAEVRRALQPLVDLAMLRRCAVLGISHFTKGSAGRDPVERVTGSLSFGALARVVLATARLSEDEGGGRILARAKSNIGPDTGGFAYDLELHEPIPGIETTRILWGDFLEGSARDLLAQAEASGADPEERSAIADAKEFLLAMLRDGPADVKKIQREARDDGHSPETLKRAKKALGVQSHKQDFAKGWIWSLP